MNALRFGSKCVLLGVIAAWAINKAFLWYPNQQHVLGPSPAPERRHVPGTDSYVWPSKYDYLEDLLSLRSGYFTNVFSDETRPCSFGENSLGRQNAAEWVRTAFHDAITHDASSGTGGLDGSIMFELDRGDNARTRAAFETTLRFMGLFHTPRSSIADLLALGVYVSLANCGGPRLSFRAGRLDAPGAGAPGASAPVPEGGLASHQAIFSRAGLSNTDMISLVACGHTLGGVHGANFPEITGVADDPPQCRRKGRPPCKAADVVHFEEGAGSFADFDNAVVLEYLQGGGSNPLVHGPNATFHSDGRIFGSDDNATMRALADPSRFRERCANVLGRMLDLVPRASGGGGGGAGLSAPLRPVDVKPYVREQSLGRGGVIRFSGRIRVRVGAAAARSADDLAVELLVRGRASGAALVVGASRGARSGGMSEGHFGDRFAWFEFSTAVDAGLGMESFDIRLTEPSTGRTELHDNAGRGYPAPDGLLYQPRQSCLDSTVRDGETALRVVAAVREDLDEGTPPVLGLFLKVPRENIPVPAFELVSMPFRLGSSGHGGYRLYEVNTSLPLASWNTRFDISLGSGAKVEFQPTNVLRSASACQAF